MGQESQSIDSVFDFLYVDHVRIATLLAQLPENVFGNLESIKVVDEASEAFKKKGSASLPFTAKGELEKNSATAEKSERSYNPLWIHARQFLDVFDELGFIQRSLKTAELGALVVASGDLTVSDPRFLKPLWRSILGAVADQIDVPGFTPSQTANQSGVSRQQRRALARANQGQSEPSPSGGAQKLGAMGEVISTFLESMPHAVRGRLTSDGEQLWFMMVPERMTYSPEEIVLKLGTRVPGEWHVVGVVDALPGETEPDTVGHGEFLDAMGGATTALRQQMGRPEGDFGITPLLIFRKILASNYAGLAKT